MSPRVIPQPGRPVTVVDLDHRTEAVVVEVRDGGRTVVVETLEGERLQFMLRAGAAVYTASPGSNWPRLRFSAGGWP